MTQTTCHRCDSTRLQYQENYGYWECDDCGHTWALDADDPDYEDDTGLAFINGSWVVVSPQSWNEEN